VRVRLLLLAVLALIAAGSAGAATIKPKLVRVVKRDGAITATLTYKDWTHVRGLTHGIAYSHVTLSLRRNGRLVLKHRLCPLEGQACVWAEGGWGPTRGNKQLAFSGAAGARTPAVLIDLYTGGASCCENMFLALVGRHARWITHDWGTAGYGGERLRGHYRFVSRDNRFWYALGECSVCSYLPVQVWEIRAGGLVDVTRSEPDRVRKDARGAWSAYLSGRHDQFDRGFGPLAGWCADEYLLSRGAQCDRALRKALRSGYLDRREKPHGRVFIRELNLYLVHLGYKRG
jgi:hypothetical protein